MGLFDEFNFVETKTRAPKEKLTWEQDFALKIDEQRDIINGTAGPNKNGGKKQSWWNEKKKTANPRLGVYSLFEKPLFCDSKDKFLKVLDYMKMWEQDEKLKTYVLQAHQKMVENASKKRKK